MGEQWWGGAGVAGVTGGGAGGCCRCLHRRRASPLTCLAVCFLVLTYNLLGGFLFLALEGGAGPPAAAASGPAPPSPPPAPLELRATTVERLWSITEDLNILYKENWTKLAAKELLDFQRVLVQSLGGAEPVPTDHHRWTFSSSFLYALTLITTIGHGNVMPQTVAGKVVAVCYACVGIPLVMLYLSTVGDALARRVRALYSRLRPPPPRAPPPAPPLDRTPFHAALNLAALGRGAGGERGPCREHTRVPLALGLVPVASYVALGAAVFRATERWSLVDGCYFSFSSLATIGFGALRPGRAAASPRAEDAAVGVCCAYILVGVAVVAMCFDLVREELAAALRGVSAVCGPVTRGAARDKVASAAGS